MELTHLLAYNMITPTPAKVADGAWSFPNCGKAWERCPWLWVSQWAAAGRSQNTSICHLCGLCPLELQVFISTCVKLMMILVWARNYLPQTPYSAGPRHCILLVCRLCFFPPEESHCKCFHRNSVLCQCHCCGCSAEPTGRRCFSSQWKCHRSFHLSRQIFQCVLVHCGAFKPG